MKKSIILLSVLMLGLSVFSMDEDFQPSVNMTPRNSFSGYTNNGTHNVYPKLNYSVQEQRRQEFMKPKSVHNMGRASNSTTNMPMKMDSIPNNYDSSNMLHTPGLQNLQNVNMYF